MLRHFNPCLMDPLRRGLAAAEKYRAEKKIQKVNGPPHALDRQSFIAALPVVQTASAAPL
jgi:hypothetical protein